MEYRLKVINGANWETRTLVPRRGDNDGWAERRKEGGWGESYLEDRLSRAEWWIDCRKPGRHRCRGWLSDSGLRRPLSTEICLGDGGGHSACLASISSLFQQEIPFHTNRESTPSLAWWFAALFEVKCHSQSGRHLNWSVEAQTASCEKTRAPQGCRPRAYSLKMMLIVLWKPPRHHQ